MDYITKIVNDTTLAFYRIIGRETPTGEFVDTIDFVGEYTRVDLEATLYNLEEQKKDIQKKLLMF